MRDDMERIEKVKEEFHRLSNEGDLCGPASLKAMAKAYEIPLCYELECMSNLFTNGGGVHDRCAFFQATAVLIGIRYGRTMPDTDRKQYREKMQILSNVFHEKMQGYMCRDFVECQGGRNKEFVEKILETAVEALEIIKRDI